MADYKFVLYNQQLGTYELERAPEGWDDFSFNFKRSKEYHGVTIEYSVDLDFVADGRDFIQAVYNAYGVEGFIRLTVYERDQNAEKWIEAYTGRINLTRLKLSSLAATANIEQSGVIQKFLNLDEVNINVLATESIAGVALATPPEPFINVPLHSQSIVKNYEAWATGTAGIQRSPIVTEVGHRSATISFGFDDIKINEFGAFTYATGFSLDDEIFPHIVTVEKGEFTVTLGLSTTIKAFRRWDGNQGSGDFDKASLAIFYRINDDAPVVVVCYYLFRVFVIPY